MDSLFGMLPLILGRGEKNEYTYDTESVEKFWKTKSYK